MERSYRDYFIIDGQHIGRYEDMYRNCPDPWRIEELGLRLDMRAALLLLECSGRKISRFLDVGAGLGLFTGLLCREIWRKNPEAEGVVTDISASAVAGAEKRLADPRLIFQPLDVRELKEKPVFPSGHFDLVVMAQVLWGILEDLDRILACLADILSPDGLLLVSQHFPGPERQTYGADIVASPEDLAVKLTQAGLSVIEALETNRDRNHHWAALIGRRT